MSWEETAEYIRSGHRSTDDFQEDAFGKGEKFNTITIDADKGIKAVIGKPKGQESTEIQSYLFAKDKGWTLEKAKAWYEEHKSECLFRHDLNFNLQFLTEKADPNVKIFPWSMPAQYYAKPGRMVIYGGALTAGKTRKGDNFSCEELRRGARSLIGGPIELFEHTWDVGESRWLPYPDNVVLDAEEVDGNIEYVAGVNEAKAQDLIRKGEVNQVSVNAICRHVPADDPGQCNGMILNGFCLLHKDSVAASSGTSVKVWNCCRRCAGQLKSSGLKPGLSESGGSKLKKKVEEMTIDEIKARVAELIGQREDLQNKLWPSPPPQPSSEEQKALRIQLDSIDVEIKALEIALGQQIAQNNASSSSAPASSTIAAPAATVTAQDDREKLKQAQLERAQKCGIAPKDGGNLTKPSEYANIPDDQFADLTNYRYPVDAEHVQAALSYFNQSGNRTAGGYSAEESARILERIVRAALSQGKTVQYQAEDAAYKALPGEVKSKLEGYQKPQSVVAAVIPVARLPKPEVMVKVEELEAIVANRRLFTAELKLRGILDLCESKRVDANG
jgi:hypothetical protein